MSNYLLAIRRHSSLLGLPLWAGLLALPLTGARIAFQIIIAAGIGTLLWRLLKAESISSFYDIFLARFSLLKIGISKVATRVHTPVGPAVGICLLVLIPLGLNDYYRDIMTLTCMYIVLALGLNIVVGQAGLLNLGYVAFYAIGAYSYAILSTSYGLSFWPGIVIGALTAAAVALFLGMPILRLRGDYFAIVTLGLGEITRIVLNNWDSVTGGPNGISKIGRPVLAGRILNSTLEFYYLILFIAVITVFAMRRLIASRIGRAWIAIREDEIAAEAMGVNTLRLKLLAFVLGSAWAGMTGVFFAAKMAFVSPESFTFFESVLILCMVVLGGMGSIPGIILGAFLLIALPEIFRDFQDFRMLAFGLALILMMVFKPQGLLGAARK